MIKVNLLPNIKESRGALSAAGLDLSKVNIKFVTISVIIVYGLKIPLFMYERSLSHSKNEEIQALLNQEKQLLGEILKFKDVEKQFKETVDLANSLRGRKDVIDARLKERKALFEL